MGLLNVEFDEMGLVNAWSGDSLPTHTIAEALSGTPSALTLSLFNKTMSEWELLSSVVDEVIGYNSRELSFNVSIVRFYESELGNLLADALLFGTGTDSLVTPGGLRASERIF